MDKLRARLNSKGMQQSIGRFRSVLDFTTAIEDELRVQNISQKAFAKKLGKSPSWISQVLHKKPNLTFFTAYDLADALGLEIKLSVTPRSER